MLLSLIGVTWTVCSRRSSGHLTSERWVRAPQFSTFIRCFTVNLTLSSPSRRSGRRHRHDRRWDDKNRAFLLAVAAAAVRHQGSWRFLHLGRTWISWCSSWSHCPRTLWFKCRTAAHVLRFSVVTTQHSRRRCWWCFLLQLWWRSFLLRRRRAKVSPTTDVTSDTGHYAGKEPRAPGLMLS